MDAKTATIQALNDALRRSFQGGSVNMTAGIAAIADDVRAVILQRVRYVNAFDHDNDPYGEHDFGAFEEHGYKVFWKIDYYTKDMSGGSEHPEDPIQTARVLTVMLAEEY